MAENQVVACFTDGIKQGRNFLRKALYRVFTWAEIEPIYGRPWAKSVKKAAEARKAASKIARALPVRPRGVDWRDSIKGVLTEDERRMRLFNQLQTEMAIYIQTTKPREDDN